MVVSAEPESDTLYRIAQASAHAELYLVGDWGAAARPPAASRVARDLGRPQRLVIDGGQLANGHPRVAAFVHCLAQALGAAGTEVELRALPDNVSALMDLASPAPAGGEEKPAAKVKWLAQLGMRALARWRVAEDAAALVGQALVKTPALVSGRAQTRWRDFVELVQETGAASLPVVTVVNLLIGAVLGFIGAVQLASFGAGMYLADLVGIAAAREMSAIMTAFIMAGRIGATFAAHLATMESNEEIDALRMIGVSPFEFLALPRLAALTLMMPLLYLYGTALAIVGGMVVAHIVLGTPPAAFIVRLHEAVAAREFIIGLIKSIAFGILIALASCYIGLHAGRNAAEVGRAATRTVVVCIIGVISIDALAALCTNALGI